VISAYFKTDVKDGKVGFYTYTKSGSIWTQFKEEGLDVASTEDWVKKEMSILVTPGTTKFRIGLSLEGEAEVWMDDVVVTAVEIEHCPMPDSLSSFMDECLNLVMEHSLFADRLDRSALLDTWRSISSCAETLDDAGEGFQLVLRSVDNHSFFQRSEIARQWANQTIDKKDEDPDFPLTTGSVMEDIGYVNMPYFSSGNYDMGVFFADKMQQLIDSLDAPDIKGWILDLRGNGGGNCWPMLAGIGPILGEGLCGHFIDGERKTTWSYDDGVSWADTSGQSSVSGDPYNLLRPDPPVAVLVGPLTASSGEVVALAFKGRPNTRHFGEQTAGFTTGNNNHELSNGGILFLAESVYADRFKKEYPDYLQPDEEIVDDPATVEDEIILKAKSWLDSIK